ncbi:hypothetical protein [Lacipirellula limnantheis]|uniref:Ion channel n=1 Tax=Lacipirellula limnantheis TaxID=2528024 RepID=A0A517TVC0_9BACT|nr:hypothetical protein [Lacipirellula limnantheis]QDT72319.1 hypothetical protein I41_14910 [Lacipirellula limnantheis]
MRYTCPPESRISTFFRELHDIVTHRAFNYESRNEPLLTRGAFARRLGVNLFVALLLIAASLLAGMAGYHHFESMAWIDAFANASMILSGMGPLVPMQTWGGKCFAGWYALYSGLALILVSGLILAPILHRLMHRFHLDTEDDDSGND